MRFRGALGEAHINLTGRRDGSAQVVVKEPGHGLLALGGATFLGQRRGVLADEVMETIPATSGLIDQMVAIEIIETRVCGTQISTGKGGGGKGIDIASGTKAQSPEEPLPLCVKVPEREVECRSY